MDEFEKQKLREMSNSALYRRVVELENTVGKLQEELREQDHKFEVDKREYAQELTESIREYYQTAIHNDMEVYREHMDANVDSIRADISVIEEILEIEQ